MALRIPELADHSATQYDIGIGHGAQAMQELGGRPRPGGTIESLGRHPPTLAAWAKSRKRTPDAVEEQTFAKAALALIQVALVLGYDRTGPPPLAGIAAAAAAVPPLRENDLQGPAPQVARRRAAAAMPLAVRFNTKGGAVGVVSRLTSRAYQIAPCAVAVFVVLAVAVCLRHPDIIFVFPVA